MPARNGSYDRLAGQFVEFLYANPDSTAQEIRDNVMPEGGPTVGNIVSHVRNKYGDEVLVTGYSRDRCAYVYRLGIDAQDGRRYVSKRKGRVRNESANLVGVCDRIIARWPDEAGNIVLVRAMLESIVRILDAA